MNDDRVSALQKLESATEDRLLKPVMIDKLLQSNGRCFLAVVRPENLAHLVKLGMQFFALNSTKLSIVAGDRIVLYKSKDGSATKTAGIVGTFKVIGNPYSNNQRLFARGFSTHIPWVPTLLALEHPLPFAFLVPQLRFIINKQNYGSALQGTLKRLPDEDYNLIEAALANHIDSLKPETTA